VLPLTSICRISARNIPAGLSPLIGVRDAYFRPVRDSLEYYVAATDPYTWHDERA